VAGASKSVATLPLRLSRQCDSAMQSAGTLSANDVVDAVFCPKGRGEPRGPVDVA